MDNVKIKKSIKDYLPTRRRLIQLYAALLHNANLKGYLSGQIFTGNTKYLCAPGLNCYSCPGAVGACPLGALQNALASSGNRAPYYVLGILLLLGLTLGRTICGYLCPFGLIQELLHKLPTPKIRKNRVTRALSYLKYIILAVFVVAIPLWYVSKRIPMPGFCKYICPAGTFGGAIGLLANPANADKLGMLDILFTRKFIILVLVFTAGVFLYRPFCRFLCPLGAIYGLFARVNIVGVKVEQDKCTRCGLCVGRCKMDIRRVGDHECIHCGECVDECPAGAIALRAGKRPLREKKRDDAKPGAGRYAAWAVALAVLIGALIYFNGPWSGEKEPESGAPAVTVDESIPVGPEVGQRGPDFTVPLYGGGEFSLADTRGKVTVINFWATWCTPCVNELPHFQKLYETYGDDVAVVALHSDLVTDDVDAYLAGFDYTIPFALDDSGVVAAYGGSAMLPQTIVLDRTGVVVYNQVGSVTYEALESLVTPLLEQ